jgi:hypothetical protein
MRFEYEGTVPPGYVLQTRPDTRFLVPGVILLPVGYGLSQLWFIFLGWNAWSLVPIVGPLTQYFVEQGRVGPLGTGELNLAVIGTVAQVLGATGIIVGLVKPRYWLEQSAVTVVPTPGGVAVAGSF